MNSVNLPRILSTRPQVGGEKLQVAMISRGLAVELLHAPALNIEINNGLDVRASDYGGVIVTSNYARQIYQQNDDLKVLPLYAIGADINDAQQLASSVLQNYKGDKALLYLRGAHIAFDMAATLTQGGFTIKEQIVYSAHAADSLPQEVIEAIRSHQITAVSFFSVRSAQIFERLALEAGLKPLFSRIKALCLSEQVVQSLSKLAWQEKRVSASKTMDSMIDLIEHLFDFKE